jgi:ABC-type multidrug transport system ATPase subunit
MIRITHISKSFGKKQQNKALIDINLTVEKGELFGLIGPDGAGKTTLFRILTTLILPDHGNAVVAGHDIVTDYQLLRKKLGYMPGRFSLYQDLSVSENLEFYASIFNTTIEKNYHLIQDIYVQLEPFKDRRAGALSGGMKQKLALCCALIHKPEVLFLDEPTTGVDVVSRKEFWEMLGRLKNEGITIFVSTPYMDEASLCDRIALIQNGRILSESTPSELIHGFDSDLFGVKTAKMNDARKSLLNMKNVDDVYAFGEFLHLKSKKGMINETDIFNHLEYNTFTDINVIKIQASIEDCFMDLMHS